MLAKLRKLLVPEDTSGYSSNDRAFDLAAVVLLVDVARADFKRDPSECRALKDRLISLLGLETAAVDQLVDDAERNLDRSVSLHEHVDVINECYSPEQKFNLVCALWHVAYSDGVLHHYEEHLIRRLADLLYVPHRDFIRAKHVVQATKHS